ncbi:Na+/H+ antiporter NhaA [Lignipirellula cremea]|uniref:Na(+)/H(+) antiporter NhaA n=1 Tax=Lignipirellula cremea TaxID=2528010 RepID=A0A518E140_9BACT|nr:Na+/H+ antiporter NhaA [Lignipirellula cremea]QDU97784.1 Na(+)/H(+) antiporter NhaA [Lignipirellula cremea]
MSQKNSNSAVAFLFENSVFLIAGAIVALVWANMDPATYKHLIKFEFQNLLYDKDVAHGHGDHAHDDHAHDDHAGGDADHAAEGTDHADATGDSDADHADTDTDHAASGADHAEAGADHADHGSDAVKAEGHSPKEHHGHPLDIQWFVNDVLMALFFAIAGKEVWEALLPGGALSNPKKAATPLFATLGGVLGPVLVYLTGVFATGHWDDLAKGWAIPCATDIAFSYLVARLIFGATHPAIAFLLLLAIADDAIGLVILAVAYRDAEASMSQYLWLLLTVGAVGIGYMLRYLRVQNFWFYLLIPGVLSWLSFYYAGIHPALGLVPIIPTMPHAHTDLGLFSRMELKRPDTLNQFEHWWKNPVEIILGLFGLVNAGVVFSAAGAGTVWVLVGLLLGKPMGIVFFTWVGDKVFKLEMPKGMNYRHVVAIGLVASIGFTVALFVSTVAFKVDGSADPVATQAIQDSVKMGALGSFFGAVLAFIGAKLMGIKPLLGEDEPTDDNEVEAAH